MSDIKKTSTTTAELTIERCSNSYEWDRFVERVDGPPYALWGWGDAAELYGHDRWYLAASRDDDIVAALPLVHMKSRLFGSKLVSPPYGERGSVLLDESDLTADRAATRLFERTRALANALGVDFVSLRGSRVMQAPAYEHKNRFVTYRVPLESTETVWENIKDSRQRQITQAEDATLTFRTGETLGDLKAYYELSLRSMRGHGTPPHSFTFHKTLWDTLGEDNVHLGMVERDGELINAILDFSLGSTVYQWGVVNDYEYRDLNGGSLALWKSLERAAEAGHETYEFGRTREGSGVYLFKKSFGGRKTWYDDLHYFPSGSGELPHPEDDSYDQVKKVWRRLPIPVTQYVGPQIRGKISL
ncbi:GNAT family N-acetyltransferase [Haloprofundus sp. MHR1]|uniref:GNAT family N-acetyltransferase n=1 Tax=Haloprofundus sp. MHR1 TaxID=2572921 RepID=UPI0010BED13D|nr:GNAT family N-acetyltransferase [Haloprofundus sp. MHR1]QCJ47431.1 GNAT family N-acetyltransferase [Haloprofundus sp. MHR1]